MLCESKPLSFLKALLYAAHWIKLKKCYTISSCSLCKGSKREEIMLSENVKKISMVEKVGYASGDFACNLIYATVSTYLLFFYTDVLVYRQQQPVRCFSG